MTSEQFVHVIIHGEISTEENTNLKNLGATMSRANSLTGGDITTEALIIASSAVIIKALKDIVVSLIQSRHKIELKSKRIHLKNVTMKEAVDLLDKLDKSD